MLIKLTISIMRNLKDMLKKLHITLKPKGIKRDWFPLEPTKQESDTVSENNSSCKLKNNGYSRLEGRDQFRRITTE